MTKLVKPDGTPVAPTRATETTWASMMPALVLTAVNAPQSEARDLAWGQLMKLADIVDEHIANLKKLRACGADKGYPYGDAAPPTRTRDETGVT